MSSKQVPIGYVLHETSTEVQNMTMVSDKGRRVIAEGIIQTANETNRNGRYYQSSELFPELNSPRTLELLKSGNLKGEDGHPQNKDLMRQQNIDPMFTCVKYLKLWTKGDDIWAQFRGDNTARGEYFDLDLRDGDKPSFSLRALGTIDNKGGKALVKNIKVVTWDRVYYPSHPRAYTKGLVTESAGSSPNQFNRKLRERGISESGLLTIGESTNEAFVNTEASGIITPIMNNDVINFIKSESANLNVVFQNFDVFYDTLKLSEDGNYVQMCDKSGNTFQVYLENYISNEIMDYCIGLR